ncbi:MULTISPECIES: FAD-dependent oxidoreductase [unclassified Fusibacter]|uniref:FAD-dependent oxidoreductase n=1 Tax=unclassified Fusibacter TaxID=2624464 RepID=UPI001012C440|nr:MULTISPECIES: FAD-dependent oxidoreductase [unclassified Fusibacter]MCK8060052.1 FAD-dependent oxidoreductase [Fusibacter sp. A2]NPE22194.1 FAD-dependent oxidoreductase [Fusibacter sp. A1]RXV60970.1 4Fe-4S dicluster domain-containing protein [Fusibacter sp. A1]
MDNKIKSMFSPIRAWKYLMRTPVTIAKKDIFVNPREASERYRGFHQNDMTKCIGCGTCSEICPTAAINLVPVEGIVHEDGKLDERPAFDYGRCSFCGLCVDICTSDSLNMSKEYLHLSIDADSFYFMPDSSGIHKTSAKVGYTRDEISELLDLVRQEMQHEDESRRSSFIEIVKGYAALDAKNEAARCVACGICTNTCPANMHIPEYIRAVFDEDLKEGIRQIYKTNPLANVCGRICTHKCETVCAIGHRGEPVAIRWLKRYIVDNADATDYNDAAQESVTAPVNGKVAVVGSGPAGLSCAYYLRTLGYEVVVFESQALPGGVIRYGGPQYRLPEESVLKDIGVIENAGVTFKCSTKVGVDITLDELRDSFDAVFLGTGFSLSRPLKIPGYDHEDVQYAIPFLAQTRDYIREIGPMPDVAEKVTVIGGGNVAFDVARTLIRLQEIKYGKSFVQMASLEDSEHLPADLEELEEGLEEGLHGYFAYGPMAVKVEDGKIKGLEVKKVLSIFDEEGRFNPSYDEHDVKLLESSQVYMAIGQMPEYAYFNDEMRDELLTKRGQIAVTDGGQVESYPWLFAGGDIVRGPDIINGVATGHDSAKAIDNYLQSKK